MTDFIVSGTGDVGPGSLRQAIIDANTTPGIDTITFAPTLAGQTITLTSGELLITGSLTVDGDLNDDGIPDITIARDAASPEFRIINIDDGNGAPDQDVTLDGLVITGGRISLSGAGGMAGASGGGIRSVENLTLNHSVVSGNATLGEVSRGGGIGSGFGGLTLNSSTVSDNSTAGTRAYGGGLWHTSGPAILNNSTISGNETSGALASAGGAFFARNTAILNNSTISGNTTTGTQGYGGGLFTGFGRLTLNNSTVSGNSTVADGSGGGGISARTTELVINNSTISGNTTAGNLSYGGGIAGFETNLSVRSSIVSGNQTALVPADEIFLLQSTVDASASNLFGENTNPTAAVLVGLIPDASDITATVDGSNPTALATILLPLADNGGPTLTHALPQNSPAIDNGINPEAFLTDQRGMGFSREFGAGVDIGAFELQPVTPPVAIPTLQGGGLLLLAALLVTTVWRYRTTR